MKLWRRIFGAEPAPPQGPFARKHIVEVDPTAKIPAHLATASALRRRMTVSAVGSVVTPQEQAPKRGMWVRWQSRTGILTKLESGDIATVMLVDDQLGQNVLEVHKQASELRQAYYEEIPSARRPVYDVGSRMGYVKVPRP